MNVNILKFDQIKHTNTRKRQSADCYSPAFQLLHIQFGETTDFWQIVYGFAKSFLFRQIVYTM